MGLFANIFWLGWMGRSWVIIDAVGVVWSGFRFRWDQVASWKAVFTPYTGSPADDDCGGDSYRLFVTLIDGNKRDREDIWPGKLAGFFDKYVPDKRERAEPNAAPDPAGT